MSFSDKACASDMHMCGIRIVLAGGATSIGLEAAFCRLGNKLCAAQCKPEAEAQPT